MKREARLLKEKAISSLVLAIELFNRPQEDARVDGVLIMLDHSFEMFLKAAIINRGGKIRESDAPQTIGFDACVRKAVSDAQVQFLTEEQALTLQTINGYRDAAQHHLLSLSEQLFYLYTRAGVSLFAELLSAVFDENLSQHLPPRVLPISSEPPKDLPLMIDDEVSTIETLIASGSRKQIEAKARLRALVIADSAAKGEYSQPSERELDGVVKRLKKKESWENVFPSLASIATTVEGDAIPYAIKIEKKEGVPIVLVKEGTPGARVVAVKRVDELGFYNLARKDLAGKLGITTPRLTAVIRALRLDEDEKYSKEFSLGAVKQRRFSQEALKYLQSKLPELDMAQVWRDHGVRKGSAASRVAK